ncbi:MAG: fibronectin type III domain-containing protein [Trueperaceae bacterium]|nr:fibronectin type III domain-containing protein [Trueperaceae bacterium]
MRQTNARHERSAPRLLRAAAALLLAAWVAGAAAQTLSITDTTPYYGQTSVTISSTGGSYVSTSDYVIGAMLIIGDTELSRSDVSVSDVLMVVSGSDAGLNVDDVTWGPDFTLSGSDWSNEILGTYPMKLFTVTASDALPTSDPTTGTIESSAQIQPGKGRQAGTVVYGGDGVDPAEGGAFVSGGDLIVSGTNWGPGDAGTVRGRATAFSDTDVGYWTAFYTSTASVTDVYTVSLSDDETIDGSATVPNLGVESSLAVLTWFATDAGDAFGYDVAVLSSVDASPTPTLATTPTDVTVDEGELATFVVSATSTSGTVSIVDWEFSPSDAGGWTSVATETRYVRGTSGSDHTLTVSPTTEGDDGLQVRALFTNKDGSDGLVQEESSPVTLTVNAVSETPTFENGTPADQTVVVGQDATFGVEVSPTGTTFAYAYQWQESTNNGVSWTDVSRSDATGVTASDLVIANVDRGDDGLAYRVIATLTEQDAEGNDKIAVTVTSSDATLTVATAGAPTNVRVYPDDGKVWVAFEAPEQTGFDIVNYEYDLEGDDKPAMTLNPRSTDTLIAIDGLTNDDTHRVRVRAVAAGTGDAEWSAYSETFTVGAASAPTTTGAVVTPDTPPEATVENGVATFSFDVTFTNDADDTVNDVWVDLRDLTAGETVTSVVTAENNDGTIRKVGSAWLWQGADLATGESGTVTVTVEVEVEE